MAGPGGKELKANVKGAQGSSGATGSLSTVKKVSASAKPKSFKGSPTKTK